MGTLRIIAGRHRGRRLPVPSLPGLRPTSDRVRETLFNWLAPVIDGARCLDLFAGSGALGLEALSRGAGELVMVDRAEAAVRQLRASLATLGEQGGQCRVEVVKADALRWLRRDARPFDLILLDPPFDDDLLAACCDLIARGWLADSARVYLEAPVQRGLPVLPPGWQTIREGRAGGVAFALVLAGA